MLYLQGFLSSQHEHKIDKIRRKNLREEHSDHVKKIVLLRTAIGVPKHNTERVRVEMLPGETQTSAPVDGILLYTKKKHSNSTLQKNRIND